jgi:hypothetical protein
MYLSLVIAILALLGLLLLPVLDRFDSSDIHAKGVSQSKAGWSQWQAPLSMEDLCGNGTMGPAPRQSNCPMRLCPVKRSEHTVISD